MSSPLVMIQKYRPTLETILEVPFKKNATKLLNKMKSSIVQKNRSKQANKSTSMASHNGTTLASLLKVIGAPLTHSIISSNDDDHQNLGSRDNYIVRQYIAAVGGENALSSSDNLCATGKMKVVMSDGAKGSSKNVVVGSNGHGMQGMLWQKGELWCLDLMLSDGYKFLSTGSVVEAALPWHDSYGKRVPPLPLGHLLQGFNPRLTASLFSASRWCADKSISKEDCFVLEIVSDPLKLSGSSNVEIVRHSILGYFSQKTGFLVKLEDSLQLMLTIAEGNYRLWKSTKDTDFQDFKAIDGVQIAHKVITRVALQEEGSQGHSLRSKVKLVWELNEVDFDVKGLSKEWFLPRSDLKTREKQCCAMVKPSPRAKSTPILARLASFSLRSTKTIPIDDSDEELEDFNQEEDIHKSIKVFKLVPKKGYNYSSEYRKFLSTIRHTSIETFK